jgi:hypothetical protein
MNASSWRQRTTLRPSRNRAGDNAVQRQHGASARRQAAETAAAEPQPIDQADGDAVPAGMSQL